MSCGEIFPYDRLSCGEVSPHEKWEENLSHRKKSPHECGAKCVMWRNMEKSFHILSLTYKNYVEFMRNHIVCS